MGEVNIDKDNAIEITSLKIQLEAVEDKIIVMMDQYKSGYECTACGGTGKVKSGIVENAERECGECNGKGATLVIPEISKSLPTLGTVVSVGEKTRWAKYQNALHSYEYTPQELETEKKDIKIRPGARVLFQPHIGTMIPFRGNIRLKIMREHEPLCVLYGSDVDAKNFLDYDQPF